MFRRSFMRIISIPAQTLNMFFRSSQDESTSGGGSGIDGRSQVGQFSTAILLQTYFEWVIFINL